MSPYRIEARIGISCPVDHAYERLSQIDQWPRWSPIHKAATGTLGFGAFVAFEEYYEGLGRWEVSGTVADYSPLSHIHIVVPKPFWAGSLIRYYEFEILSDTACSFTAGAAFDGFFSVREGKRYGTFLKSGFQAMAEALKSHAEG